MNTTTHRTIVTAAVAGALSLIPGFHTVAAGFPQWPGPCLAIDDEPMCEIIRPTERPGASGGHVQVVEVTGVAESDGAIAGVTIGCGHGSWLVVVACAE